MTDFHWAAYLARIGEPHSFVCEQSLWAICVYRFGCYTGRRRPETAKVFLLKIYWALFEFVETQTGMSLPKDATSGPGIRIWYFRGISIHTEARIGAECKLRQGVTLGNRDREGIAQRMAITWN